MPQLITNPQSANQLLAKVKAPINPQPPNCPNCYLAPVVDWFLLRGSGYFVYQATCCQRKYIKKQGFCP